MAESAKIFVSIIEGPYTILKECGVPLPVCVSMQDKGLLLGNAQWTARHSNCGFSVSFFWPALESKQVATTTVVKKSRKRKRRPKKAQYQESSHKAVMSQIQQKSPSPSPITAHPSNNATSKEPVDLTACESVSFEMHDHHPGVKYSLNGEEKWTPVKKRRCKKRNQLNVTVTNSSFDDDSHSSTSSSSELDVSCSRLVQYSEHDGTPGLSIHRRNIVWAPIAPNPIASRTRSRTKS